MAKKGRPSKYKKEYCEELIDFFDREPYEEQRLDHYYRGSKEIKWVDTKRVANKLPTMVEFVKYLNNSVIKNKKDKVNYRTVYDWLDPKHSSFKKEFSQTFTHIAKELQKNHLLQNALQGLYNPTFAIFTAVNITDMNNINKIEHSGEIKGGVVYMPKQRKEDE